MVSHKNRTCACMPFCTCVGTHLFEKSRIQSRTLSLENYFIITVSILLDITLEHDHISDPWFLCLLCNSRHNSHRVSSIWVLYVSMYTRILISEDSVFRRFTYKPINGLSIQRQLNIGCYRISPHASFVQFFVDNFSICA